jgi:hypothetical protein
MAEPTYSYARQSRTVSYSAARCPAGDGYYALSEAEDGYELRRSRKRILRTCGSTGRYFVREGERVIRITSKELKRKLRNSKSHKRVANRSTVFKSASWYANAARSIGVSAKNETSSR